MLVVASTLGHDYFYSSFEKAEFELATFVCRRNGSLVWGNEKENIILENYKQGKFKQTIEEWNKMINNGMSEQDSKPFLVYIKEIEIDKPL